MGQYSWLRLWMGYGPWIIIAQDLWKLHNLLLLLSVRLPWEGIKKSWGPVSHRGTKFSQGICLCLHSSLGQWLLLLPSFPLCWWVTSGVLFTSQSSHASFYSCFLSNFDGSLISLFSYPKRLQNSKGLMNPEEPINTRVQTKQVSCIYGSWI